MATIGTLWATLSFGYKGRTASGTRLGGSLTKNPTAVDRWWTFGRTTSPGRNFGDGTIPTKCQGNTHGVGRTVGTNWATLAFRYTRRTTIGTRLGRCLTAHQVADVAVVRWALCRATSSGWNEGRGPVRTRYQGGLAYRFTTIGTNGATFAFGYTGHTAIRTRIRGCRTKHTTAVDRWWTLRRTTSPRGDRGDGTIPTKRQGDAQGVGGTIGTYRATLSFGYTRRTPVGTRLGRCLTSYQSTILGTIRATFSLGNKRADTFGAFNVFTLNFIAIDGLTRELWTRTSKAFNVSFHAFQSWFRACNTIPRIAGNDHTFTRKVIIFFKFFAFAFRTTLPFGRVDELVGTLWGETGNGTAIHDRSFTFKLTTGRDTTTLRGNGNTLLSGWTNIRTGFTRNGNTGTEGPIVFFEFVGALTLGATFSFGGKDFVGLVTSFGYSTGHGTAIHNRRTSFTTFTRRSREFLG